MTTDGDVRREDDDPDTRLWPADEHVALITVVATGDAATAVDSHVRTLVADRVASRVTGQDADLWGEAARDEASKRLGWVTLPESSRSLVDHITALRAELLAEGVDRVVLCGMGGSSLAPEVITATAGVELVVLDSTEPSQVQHALTELRRTVVVVSSKSGSTVETDSHRRIFEAAFDAAGIDGRRRIVVVTDPGSPLHELATATGYRAVFAADPGVGGRYSALTAFGLVPAGLAGADITALLDEASAVADLLADDSDGNPALQLGAALGGTSPLRDKIAFVDLGSGIPGFADWVEQLVAESTGKNGTGLLPVVVHGLDAPEVLWPADDVLVVRLLPPGEDPSEDLPTVDKDADAVGVAGPLGAQFLLWEYATVIAGRLLGINPFDQPDVESAKAAARGLLDAQPAPSAPVAVDGAVEIRAGAGLLAGAQGPVTVRSALDALLGQLSPNGYLAVMAYLNRHADAALAGVRNSLAKRSGRPVTFGWGPRFLHSTGQYHKGGAPVGVFLQITGTLSADLPVPERPFTFGQLIAAQAAGDAQVLEDHGRPVLRLNLTDPSGLDQLIAALSEGA